MGIIPSHEICSYGFIQGYEIYSYEFIQGYNEVMRSTHMGLYLRIWVYARLWDLLIMVYIYAYEFTLGYEIYSLYGFIPPNKIYFCMFLMY